MNSGIREHKLYIRYSLLDEQGTFYSLSELQSKYKIKTNFLVYASLQTSVKSTMK